MRNSNNVTGNNASYNWLEWNPPCNSWHTINVTSNVADNNTLNGVNVTINRVFNNTANDNIRNGIELTNSVQQHDIPEHCPIQLPGRNPAEPVEQWE